MMATQTTNLHLVKPAANEKVNIATINGNMDIIDNACDFGMKSWTPHLYDLNSYVRDLANGGYIKIGRWVIAYYSSQGANLSGVSTMIQIRNLPMDVILGGNAYFASLQQSQYTHPVYVQSGTTYLYLRPNIKSSEFSDATSQVFGFCIIGLVN